MINDKAKSSYYFTVKNLLDLNSLEWLRGKKEAIINGINSFQNALNELLIIKPLKHTPRKNIKNYALYW